jgi:hypothetical protein
MGRWSMNLVLRSIWFLMPCVSSSLIPLCALAASPPSGSVPFVLEGNRVYARLEFVPAIGKPRRRFVFVDLGSPSMAVSKALYRDLHLGSNTSLTLRIGEMPITVESATVISDAWLPFSIGGGRRVDAVLPASAIQRYQVRFDYARRLMTIAQPRTLRPEGTAVPFRVNQNTGLIAIEAAIDGKTYPITIDSGSGYTWIRKSAAREWLVRHPDWQRGTGAVGPSNMRMADDGIETTGDLVRIPEIGLGALRVQDVGALAISRDNSGNDFMDWYSTKNAVPVIGWLGGNVLRGFRITIDYPEHVVSWVRQRSLVSDDLDYIGLTLISRRGEYFVGAIVTRGGKPTVDGVQVGDKLVQIGALRTHGASREAMFAAMRGRPGELRSLVLDRDGRQVRLEASVTAF